jgi:glycosyltransferase involved in cell wall biosynthesis
MKMFEYMASGKAIIASDLPVFREILSDLTAIFAAPDDIDAWTAALRRLKDPNLRKIYGMRARRCFEEKYTWEHRAKNLLVSLGSVETS